MRNMQGDRTSSGPDQLAKRCRALLQELDPDSAGNILGVTPLTGGVASDIAMVELPDRRLCIKFALPKLKVAADWRAPVHRNRAEYAWLEVAARVDPDNALRLYGRSSRLHGFVMEYLEGDNITLWKRELLAGRGLRGEAARVAALLGRLHAASTEPDFECRWFCNREDFHALRIAPYLLYTAARHSDLSTRLHALAGRLDQTGSVLIHGDVSPKNILFRNGQPVLLDAECATLGDASFDVAFCLNHLVLKAVHLRTNRRLLLAELSAFWSSYAARLPAELLVGLEQRVAALLPALMLARVDGKSPVDYLAVEAGDAVRATARTLLTEPVTSIDTLTEQLVDAFKDTEYDNDHLGNR